MSNRFPTTNLGEFILFCCIVFFGAIILQGIGVGIIAFLHFLLNFGR